MILQLHQKLRASLERVALLEKENASLQARLAKAEGRIDKVVISVLKSYRCQYTSDFEGSGLALVDKLCSSGRSDIATGRMEMWLLKDAICGAIMGG